MSLFKAKKIGIWGFGKTGQSILAYVGLEPELISVLESSPLSDPQKALLKKYNALIVTDDLIPQFLEFNDFIIASPGVDISSYQDYADKFISELDIFASEIRIKTIAVTGSVGKTTVTTLLTELLCKNGIRATAGGNIGTPMLDLLPIQKNFDIIVLELSSFQLEYSKSYAPSIAVITNIFPNHLDRHGTMYAYLEAKAKLLAYQTDEQWAVIPQAFLEDCIHFTKHQKVIWVSDSVFKDDITPVLSDITFLQNWQLILTTLELLEIDPAQALEQAPSLKLPEHRVEYVATHDGVAFYNDSKSTIAQATIESVKRFKPESLILFVGGIAKGVDRSELVNHLPTTLKQVLCFGSEAEQLKKLCTARGIKASSHATFESAWTTCLLYATAPDTVLFSPGGASYDLFKNYEVRGSVFKEHVLLLKK